jgi:hypothetical protein
MYSSILCQPLIRDTQKAENESTLTTSYLAQSHIKKGAYVDDSAHTFLYIHILYITTYLYTYIHIYVYILYIHILHLRRYVDDRILRNRTLRKAPMYVGGSAKLFGGEKISRSLLLNSNSSSESRKLIINVCALEKRGGRL